MTGRAAGVPPGTGYTETFICDLVRFCIHAFPRSKSGKKMLTAPLPPHHSNPLLFSVLPFPSQFKPTRELQGPV